ncbi:phage virion morphogenesis protein [Morganella morganii]|nr:phage virion morphogenesis protein [Morganella morganii]
MIRGQLNQSQFNKLREALKQHDLTPQKRQKLLIRLAKSGVIGATKRNIKKQQSPDGEPWEARKSKRRKKMLSNMPKLLKIKEIPETDSVRIYLGGGKYRNGSKPVSAGVVGYSQQNGNRATVKKSSISNVNSKRNKELKASKKQAKKLRELGYKVRNGKSWKKPSIKSIEADMTFWQAGLLIRMLSDEDPKDAWAIELPARVFLGIGQEDFEKALARELQGIGFG